MTRRQLKTGCFLLEGTTAFATSLYFYYLFFLLEEQFGFGKLENLALSALHGLVYVPMAWVAGNVAHKHGHFFALKLGFAIMTAALIAGIIAHSATLLIFWTAVWTVGMCFTWPVLESLASEGETPSGMQRMIGIYNLTWAGGSALAYFTGGAIVERMGMRTIFWLPIIVHAVQLLALFTFHSRANLARQMYLAQKPLTDSSPAHGLNPRPIARVKLFLRLAWMANPLAYVAINSLVAVIPALAGDLHLSPMFAGFFCSVWFFARWFTFLALWLWPGWHYRSGWFFTAFGLLIVSYMLILLVPHITVVIAAQVTFGMAVGLIYYSSLYYSMDAGEAKTTHSGVHEAALGFGIFLGPAVGATTLRFLPDSPNSGTVAVSALLVVGLVTLLYVWRSRANSGSVITECVS